MLYFNHDTSASTDDRILALRMEHGGAAVDAYWTVIEQIHRNESGLVIDRKAPATKSLCHWLCIGFDTLADYLDTMFATGLLSAFNEDGETEFSGDMRRGDVIVVNSKRAADNIDSYHARKETARQNGKRGGRKPKVDATEKQTETKSVSEDEPNPKLSKSKKVKVKEKEDIEGMFCSAEQPQDASGSDTTPYDEVVAYLNEVCGTHYRPGSRSTRAHIHARFADGYTLDDFKTVIDKKAAEWLGDQKMAVFLRPDTLFGTKFESYLNAPVKTERKRSDAGWGNFV